MAKPPKPNKTNTPITMSTATRGKLLVRALGEMMQNWVETQQIRCHERLILLASN